MVRNIERFRRKKDGTIVPILLTLSLLKTDEGKPLGIASITKDISELKRAEKELKEYRDHLESLVEERTADLEEAMQVAEEATRAKSDFLANMSHEIRTPLNAVIGFSHLALQTKLNDQQFDYVHKIQSSSKALLGVINDILDFSKIEAGKLSMESIEFDLEEVLDNVTNLIGIKAQQKGLEVIFNIEPTLPRVLIGDPLRLGQVLTNLTGNAVKFTEKGEIVLGCTLLQDNADEVELEFYVQDSGIGLTPDQQTELFQAFSQADSSTTRKYGGSGLGLFISKSLVEMMGGRIRVRSEIGRGATFFFTARLKKADRQPASPPLLDAELHGIKVLVVDDNPICRAALHKMLEVMSFRVTQADSAEAAFAELEMTGGDDPFDLVLMDWKMPGMDGLHASERIRNSLKLNVPSIIMVSAYAREDLMQQADSMGLDGYLVKPVSPSLLLDTIMTALGRQRPSRVSSDRQSDASPGVETIRGARLLVVEDNEINQQVARGILEHIGIIVEMADNGRLAIEALQKAGYDAVLMDIHMPEMDGYTAARQIRKDPAFNDLPIIAMTANAMAGDREKALDAGMNDHVAKPIDVNELLDVLRKWINPSDKNPLPPPAASATEEEVATRAKALGPLPGIDTREGLRRLAGDVSLYQKLLCKFAGSQSKTAERIAHALEAPDLEAARGLAHTTKGVAGNIGAMQLYETASQLDLALKNENLQKAQELLPAFSDRLETVIRSLNTLEDENEAKTESTAGIPAPDAIQPLLRNLYELLEEDDTAAGGVVRQLTGAVESDAGKDLLSRLSRQIGGYEFEAAKSTLHDLCLKLNIDLEE